MTLKTAIPSSLPRKHTTPQPEKHHNIDIYCAPAQGFLIGFSATRENYGHYDFLPFQADIKVLDRQAGDDRLKKIGTISNGRYGGPPEVHCWLDAAAGTKANELCRRHSMHYDGQPIGSYDLGSACEDLACLFFNAQKAFPKKVTQNNLIFHFDGDPVILKAKPKIPLYWA